MLTPQTFRAAALISRNATKNTKILTSFRWYRGDSGDMKHRSELKNDAAAKAEEKLLKIAAPKYEMIHERHIRMPNLEEIPKASLPLGFKDSDYTKEELELAVRKKRLVYRSKQRGW